MDKFGALEGPTYWIGNYTNGSRIWLIHDRFKKESTQYVNYGMIFSTGFDEIDSKYFEGILAFECGWSSQDRRNILKSNNGPMHKYRKTDGLYSILMRAYEYGLKKSGGCFIK